MLIKTNVTLCWIEIETSNLNVIIILLFNICYILIEIRWLGNADLVFDWPSNVN